MHVEPAVSASSKVVSFGQTYFSSNVLFSKHLLIGTFLYVLKNYVQTLCCMAEQTSAFLHRIHLHYVLRLVQRVLGKVASVPHAIEMFSFFGLIIIY